MLMDSLEVFVLEHTLTLQKKLQTVTEVDGILGVAVRTGNICKHQFHNVQQS